MLFRLRREVGLEQGRVGRIAIGKDDRRSERTILKTRPDVFQGRAEGGTVAGEIETGEVSDLAETAIKEERLHAESLTDRPEPWRGQVGRVAVEGAAEGGRGSIMPLAQGDGESGRIVGEDNDVVRVLFRRLVEVDGLHQREREEDETGSLQRHRSDLFPAAQVRDAVGEKEDEDSPQPEKDRDPRPRLVGKSQ